MNFKVDLHGLEDVKKGVYDVLSRDARVKSEVLASSLDVQRIAKDNLRDVQRIDTGNLRNTIIVEITKADLQGEIGPTAPYGPYICFGTRPHFPPPAALEEWARHHGFESAWPICKIIARRGLPARPYLVPAFENVEPKFLERLRRIFA